MKSINGYIEVDGIINKVTSVDDLKQVVQSLGKDFTELNEAEFKKLTSKYVYQRDDKTCFGDDCRVMYKDKHLIRSFANDLGEYKIINGTLVVQDNACYTALKTRVYIYNIKSIIFPSSLIAIGDRAFGCNEVNDIYFSDSIQYIGLGAFSKCNCIKGKLVLPKELRFLETSAFRYCSGISSVVFSDKIEVIGSHVFAQCTSLKSVYIPNSVKLVGSGVFDDCFALESIYIPKGSKEKFSEFFPLLTDKLVETETDETDEFSKI